MDQWIQKLKMRRTVTEDLARIRKNVNLILKKRYKDRTTCCGYYNLDLYGGYDCVSW